MTNKPHLSYRSDIDGLRAVAILSVIIYHAFPEFIPGGFIGVDVFFVISGFLISSIIFKNLRTNSFSYLDFYIRRVKRIFPALIFVLNIIIVIGYFILLPDEFESLGKHIIAGTTFISNIILWKEVDYFNTAAELKPFLHLWSLAIEEQYYIIWPILVTLIWNRTRSLLIATMITIFLSSFMINVYAINVRPEATFYLPITRFWELTMGGLLAFISLRGIGNFNEKLVKNIFSLLGLCLLIIGFSLIDTEKRFPGYWALLPTLGTFLIILAGKESWVNSKILSNKIMVFIGLISYPLYLWHWPLLAYAKIVDLTDFYHKVAILCVSFMLAYFTYVVIEKPVRIGFRNVTATLASLMLSITALGVLIYSGFIQSFHSTEETKRISHASTEWDYPGNMIPFDFNNRVFYRINNKLIDTNPDEVIFFGDSNMQMYYPNIDELSYKSKKSIIFATQGGCPPIPDVHEDLHKECNGFVEDVMTYASKPTVKTIVISSQWYGYFDDNSKYYIKNKDFHNYFFLSEINGKDYAFESLKKLLIRLHEMGKTTYLLTNIPIGDSLNPKNMINRSLANKLPFFSVNYGSISIKSLEQYQYIDTALIEIAHATKSIIIDPKIFLCEHNECQSITKTGELMYKDSAHLSPTFVRNKINFLDEVIH